ncbi:hypothetical protein ACUTAF_24990 [Pseudomonas sp. SP16.1]|uniref:hypothetical protein n=1 Tax=Pseudomonas sp. SP16.1 TaxID=3458854 RepID=UPI0040456251
MRTWTMISEPAWVARNALRMLGQKAREVAEREFISDLSRDQDATLLSQKMLSRSGPEALWALALTVIARGVSSKGYTILDQALEHAPKDAPELGSWSNYAALFGEMSTLAAASNGNLPGLFQRLKKAAMPQQVIARLLIDIQTKLDSSHQTQELIQAAGLASFRWVWTAPGSAPIEVLFHDAQSAVEWLCESFLPPGLEEASLRAKLSPLRDALRKAEIVLTDLHRDDIAEPLELIKMVDRLAIHGAIR